METDTGIKCRTEGWSCELKLKAEPTKLQLALENI